MSPEDIEGCPAALAAAACWAAYILLGGRVSRMIPGGAAVATGMTIAAAKRGSDSWTWQMDNVQEGKFVPFGRVRLTWQ